MQTAINFIKSTLEVYLYLLPLYIVILNCMTVITTKRFQTNCVSETKLSSSLSIKSIFIKYHITKRNNQARTKTSELIAFMSFPMIKINKIYIIIYHYNISFELFNPSTEFEVFVFLLKFSSNRLFLLTRKNLKSSSTFCFVFANLLALTCSSLWNFWFVANFA